MESEGLIMVEGKGFKKRILELCFLFYFILFSLTVRGSEPAMDPVVRSSCE